MDSDENKRREIQRQKASNFQVFIKSKEEPDLLILLKSINVVKGYMQVPGVDFIGSFSPVASDSSTSILIVLTLYY